MIKWEPLNFIWRGKPGGDAVVTVRKITRWFWFKPKTELVTFRGNGTVWHCATSGKRVDSFKEAWLADIWSKETSDLRAKSVDTEGV